MARRPIVRSTSPVGPVVAAAFLVALLCATPTPSAQLSDFTPYFFRTDDLNENYVTGYLTWGTAGSIEWIEPSDGPPDGPPSAQTGVVEFRSKPLPRTYYLNGSRMVQVDLYLKGSCVSLKLEIYANETLLGGLVPYDSYDLQNSNRAPRPASGYCAKPFRLQSEVDVLQRSAVLRIRVVPAGQQTQGLQFGLRPPALSVIHLPTFAPDEALFRVAELQPGAPGGSGEAPLTAAVFFVAGLPGLALLRRNAGRRSLRALALVALLAVQAGCFGSPPHPADTSTAASPSGSSTQTFVDPPEGLAGHQTGAIVGVVRNDLEVGVGGAYVSLLGTQNHSTTDPHGRFTFGHLRPGSYVLRVDREGYVSFEGSVDVVAGRATIAAVTLAPLVQGDPDLRPHRHDLFAGEPSYVAMDDDVTFYDSGGSARQSCLATPRNQFLNILSQFCQQKFLLPDDGQYPSRAQIPPGTRSVEVTVSWGALQSTVPEVGFGLMANNDLQPPYPGNYNYTLMYPRGTGVPTRVATTWEMTDIGHQKYTTWEMFLFMEPGAYSISGPFHVKVVLHRGVVPWEPAHRDYWGANSTVPVMSGAGPTSNYCEPPLSFVPPGTTWLEASVDLNRKPVNEWGIFYRAADMRPDEPRRLMKPSTRTDTRMEYVFPLDPKEPDPFYARKSAWEFCINQEKPYAPPGSYVDSVNDFGKPAVTYTVNITAHRDPPPKTAVR